MVANEGSLKVVQVIGVRDGGHMGHFQSRMLCDKRGVAGRCGRRGVARMFDWEGVKGRE